MTFIFKRSELGAFIRTPLGVRSLDETPPPEPGANLGLITIAHVEDVSLGPGNYNFGLTMFNDRTTAWGQGPWDVDINGGDFTFPLPSAGLSFNPALTVDTGSCRGVVDTPDGRSQISAFDTNTGIVGGAGGSMTVVITRQIDSLVIESWTGVPICSTTDSGSPFFNPIRTYADLVPTPDPP